jgi:cyclopropane fatty-acyl-phospholipid synthase-like methyltransferase
VLCYITNIESVYYAAIYSAEYYAGRGVDSLVDYLFELERPRATIRQHEWASILQVIQFLTVLGPGTQWLDFGCGNGGLVRYVRANSPCAIVGFEEGWIRDKAVARGIPIIDRVQLDAYVQTFDIVTAIEVLEHVIDPLAALTSIRRMLKPGGFSSSQLEMRSHSEAACCPGNMLSRKFM